MTYLAIIAVILGIIVNHAVWLLLSRRSTALRIIAAGALVLLSYVAMISVLGKVLSHGELDQGSWRDWGLLVLVAAGISIAYQATLSRVKERAKQAPSPGS